MLLWLLVLLDVLLRVARGLRLQLRLRLLLLLELLGALLRIACVLRLKLRLLLSWKASVLRPEPSAKTCLLLRIAILLLTILRLRAEG